MASSLVNYPNQGSRKNKQGLFQEEDDLSIDLNDGAAFYDEEPNALYRGDPMIQDKSFMSDMPEDFLTPVPRSHEAAPASGASGQLAQYAGTKRRRITKQANSQLQQSQYTGVAMSTQMSSTQQRPQFHHNHQRQEQSFDRCDILSGTGTGELNFQEEGHYVEAYHSSFNNHQTDSSLDSVAAMKKSKQREAAKRSRQKKKAEQNLLQHSNDKIIKENNKLKLDNAALRAENQILKRQLNYWENLFAKKTQSQTIANQQSHFENYSSATHTQTHSSTSVISREEITQQRRPTPSHNELQFKEASAHQGQPPSAGANTEEEGEISFVLERNVSASPTGNRLGLFSLALIMCICCFSSFFGPMQTTTPGLQEGVIQLNNVVGADQQSMQTAMGQSGSDAPDQVNQMSHQDSSTEQIKTAQVPMTFLQVVLHAVWINLLKLVFLVAFAFCLLLFPKEEMIQWAARKPFFRRIFDFSEVPIAAQTKFIKSDKLV